MNVHSTSFAGTAQDFAVLNLFVYSCPCASFFVTTNWLDSYASFGIKTKYILAMDPHGKVIGGAALALCGLGPLRGIYVLHGPAAIADGSVVLAALLKAIEAYGRNMGAISVQVWAV